MGPININPAHRGLLHANLGVPQGTPIPEAKIESAENSTNPAIRKRAVFAENAKHFAHHQENATHDEILRQMGHK